MRVRPNLLVTIFIYLRGRVLEWRERTVWGRTEGSVQPLAHSSDGHGGRAGSHQQGAELKVELPGLELIPTRNVGTTGKISPLYHHAGTKILLFSEYTAFEPEFRV